MCLKSEATFLSQADARGGGKIFSPCSLTFGIFLLFFSSGEGRTLVVLLDLLLLSVGELILLGGGFRRHVDGEGLRERNKVVERVRNYVHECKN